MKFLILGAGGIGSYFGTRLINAGYEVTFVARGKHLEALQKNKLKLQHPDYFFHKYVTVFSIDDIQSFNPNNFDTVLLTTKSTSTVTLSNQLYKWFDNNKKIPYIISLQNGVENEEILSTKFNKKNIIAGLTRKIGAHIVRPAIINATGNAETILGAMKRTKKNDIFLKNLQKIFTKAKIPTQITKDIKLELWKKLIINNGVNALCALLRKKTGIVTNHKKLSAIVKGLMDETATAAFNKGIKISKKEVDTMFDLIQNFDSIKPSMLVDVENNKEIELDEICNIVIQNCEEQQLDAPYTRTISTLLEYTYKKR